MMSVERKAVLGVNITFFALSWGSVSLRVLVRVGMLRNFGFDDWTMLATQALFTAYLICQLGGVIYGTGEHLDNLIPWRAEKALFFWYFCEIFYTLSTSFFKVSVGFFLLRVATHRVHLWIIRTVMILASVFGGAFFFVIIFQCWPISDWWDLDPSHKQCINPQIVIGLTYGVSALNVVADWTLGLLPIFIVRGLQMSTRQKRLVSGILAFAAIGSTATIVRLPYIASLSESFKGREGDFLCMSLAMFTTQCAAFRSLTSIPADTVGVAIWTTVEIGIGITAGCLATLRPLVRMAFDRFGISLSSHPRHTSSSGIPHSRSRITPQHHHHHYQQHPLDDFAPGHGHTTTTITSNHDKGSPMGRDSGASSQEALASTFTMRDPGKITKSFVVEYEEEECEDVIGNLRNSNLGDRRLGGGLL